MIQKLKNSTDISYLTIHESNDKWWDYNYQITGWYKGNYFFVTLSSRLGKEKIVISDLTDKKDEFKEFIYGL